MRHLLRSLWIVGLAFGPACGRREAAPPVPSTLPHFAEWTGLVDATARGDLSAAARAAVQLTGGRPTEVPDGPAGEGDATVAAALAYVGFAEDAEELADTVLRAARGCAACHTALDVAPPAPLEGDAAQRAVDTVVWARAGADAIGADTLGIR